MRNVLLVATAMLIALPTTAPAQSGAQAGVEGRVGKLESEMRAVQRKVFPGGTGPYLQPEVEAAPIAGPVPGTPATSAIADLSSRVASLEGQMAGLTGQIEQAGYRTRQVQEAFDAYRRTTDARLKALEAGPVATGAAGAPGDADDTPRPVSRSTSVPTRATGTEPIPAPVVRPTAISRPETGDAAEDAYTYGYRLWSAKRYAEAQAALKKAATDYPKSRRYSFAQNLLGRAYLDDGKPSLASMAFYENYKKMPDGERAPESLYYLAQALGKLNKPADACKVYDELGDVYAAKLTTRMKADVASGRAAAKCR